MLFLFHGGHYSLLPQQYIAVRELIVIQVSVIEHLFLESQVSLVWFNYKMWDVKLNAPIDATARNYTALTLVISAGTLVIPIMSMIVKFMGEQAIVLAIMILL